ncbi:protein amnionless-like [Corticium candelabrum]|uniref:protein amnionless-like n=1 Tax=Corticium candelabrum TaxID=121492 RepID=UPI002E259D50|nr:protein amnionless-like [Corticium candelabrum]
MSKAVFRCLLYFALFQSLLADTKRWTANTNWHNKNNWDRSDLPCSADHVLFQELDSTSYSIFVASDVVVNEIVFPLDGSLILDSGISITFSNDSECDDGGSRAGGDIEFIGGQRKNWYDVRQWETVDKLSSHELDVDLPLNRIPCEHDDVIFPDRSSFSVSIDRKVVVKSMQYQGDALSNDGLQELLLNVEGKRQFQLIHKGDQETSLSISGLTCSDSAGCPCGNSMDDANFIQEGCRTYVHDTCTSRGDLDCENPITPAGACCPVCGSNVEVTISRENQANFNYEAFKQAIYGILQGNTSGAGIVRVPPSEQDGGALIYSIFFLTGGDTEKARALSRALVNLFTISGVEGIVLPEIAVKSRIEIVEVSPTVVVEGQTSPGDDDNTKIYIGIGAAGGVVLILAVVIVVLVVQRRQSKKQGLSHSQGFGTSSLPGDKLGVVSFSNVSENATATLEGFDNPMYDERIKSNPVYDTAHEGTTVVNPVYMDEDADD